MVQQLGGNHFLENVSRDTGEVNETFQQVDSVEYFDVQLVLGAGKKEVSVRISSCARIFAHLKLNSIISNKQAPNSCTNSIA